MAVENLKEKLDKIVSKEPSKWIEEVEWRRDNRSWLKRSQGIAIRILTTLRTEGISQKALAERMNVSPQQVSKWVKGRENFTLETISKIETALNIEILSVPEFEVKLSSAVETPTSRSSRKSSRELKEKQ
jgi:plasmid maintenance system antidote protein VapI